MSDRINFFDKLLLFSYYFEPADLLLSSMSFCRFSGILSQPPYSTPTVTRTTYQPLQRISTHMPTSSSPPHEPVYDLHLLSQPDGRCAMQNTTLGAKTLRSRSPRSTRTEKEVAIG